MNKNNEKAKRWRLRSKQRLIEYKGGKCENCGYDKIQYPRAFSFHHKDPGQKDFGLSYKGRTISLEKMKAEADKCSLLCVRCHAEVHDEEFLDRREKLLKGDRCKMKSKQCLQCNSVFQPMRREQKYCCRECQHVSMKSK
jgi:hypothetical protein